MRALLVENVHPRGIAALEAGGVSDIDSRSRAIDPDELKQAVESASFLGIRSRTRVTADVLAAAPVLQAIGCFCIGVNQVDLEAASARGVPVFNAPFANARSVAELTIAAAIFLMRGIPAKSLATRRGEWLKSASNSYEVRKKKLGIVGYGNIGSQLSVIASALGMHVYFYDIEAKLAHGNARAVGDLHELLGQCDVVSLHVPSTDFTRGMMNAEAFAAMKPGAVFINYARGDLVDIDALADALKSGRLAGAAVDVFPEEPKSDDDPFKSPLLAFENVILTPHIGGSTQEAQEAIGEEVAAKLLAFWADGATSRAVNFPEVALGARAPGSVRFGHVHSNVPGVMRAISEAVADAGFNITAQALGTRGDIGYALTDLEGAPGAVADMAALVSRLQAIPGAIRVPVMRPLA